MQEQEEILSQHIKDILQKSKDDLKLTDFMNNAKKDTVSIEEGALLTLLVEAKRRNWNNDRMITYLKNETGLVMDIQQNAQCGILLMFGKNHLISFLFEIKKLAPPVPQYYFKELKYC